MSGKLKVAAVGTGYFSQFHYDAWSRCDDVELVGVADLNLEAAEKIATEFGGSAFTDAADMLDAAKPDLFDIITPPSTHMQMIQLAVDQGVNVICQKPFCGGLEDARKAVERAESAGINVTVHENFRFQPWYAAIKQQLQADRLGPLYRATFRLRPGDGQGVDAYTDRQPYFQQMERFLIHETAIHYVDVFRFLFGEVNALWADIAKLNPVISGEDSCLVIMDFDGGFRGVLDGNRLSDHVAENRRRTMGEMSIEGEKGELTLSGDGVVGFRAHGGNEVETVQFDWDDVGFGGDCVYRFTRHVVDHYRTGSSLQNSGRDYLSNLRLEEAIYRSAAEGVRQVF
ncbi:MAG: gfo/Idh/MocA family oxidoreductase [Rhizobiaceae bacterium]|nr:gfo/Idh/MocA family oxidoreductase [Rhizobiaceae bacterium]